MPDVVDRLGAALLDASLAATAITGLVVLAMVQCRQPARRRDWARAGLLSTLALLPLAALNPVPRIDLRGPLRSILPTDLDEPPRPPAPRRSSASAGRRTPGPPARSVRTTGRLPAGPRLGPDGRPGAGRGLPGRGLGRPGLDRPGPLGVGLAGPAGPAPSAGSLGPASVAPLRGALEAAAAPGLRPGDPAGPGRLAPAVDPDPARPRRPGGGRPAPPQPAPRAGPRREPRPPIRAGRHARAGGLVLPAAGLVDSRPDEARPGIPGRPPGRRPLRDLGPLRLVAGRAGLGPRPDGRSRPAPSPSDRPASPGPAGGLGARSSGC